MEHRAFWISDGVELVHDPLGDRRESAVMRPRVPLIARVHGATDLAGEARERGAVAQDTCRSGVEVLEEIGVG